MRVKIGMLMLSLTGVLLPLSVEAGSKVYNGSDRKIEVFFTAAGCAGVKSASLSCAADANALVCKKARLGPGEEAKYFFKPGTSNRQVSVFWCEGSAEGQETRGTKNKGPKKRCSVLNSGKQSPALTLKCGYSESDFKTLKAGS